MRLGGKKAGAVAGQEVVLEGLLSAKRVEEVLGKGAAVGIGMQCEGRVLRGNETLGKVEAGGVVEVWVRVAGGMPGAKEFESDEQLGVALGQLARDASVIEGEVLRLETERQARAGFVSKAGLKAEALLQTAVGGQATSAEAEHLREAVTRLEAEVRRHAEEAARLKEERRTLEEVAASLRAEVTLLQATRGKAGSRDQARTSIPSQAPAPDLQQAPADRKGFSISEVRSELCCERAE